MVFGTCRACIRTGQSCRLCRAPRSAAWLLRSAATCALWRLATRCVLRRGLVGQGFKCGGASYVIAVWDIPNMYQGKGYSAD